MSSWLNDTLKKAEQLLEQVDEKVQETTEEVDKKPHIKAATDLPFDEDYDMDAEEEKNTILIEKMKRTAKEQKARNERLVSEAREASAARIAAEVSLESFLFCFVFFFFFEKTISK
jgi:hypothetical protein